MLFFHLIIGIVYNILLPNLHHIHMLKNTEWQAVCLLSDSKYGQKNMITVNATNYSGKASLNGEDYDYLKRYGETYFEPVDGGVRMAAQDVDVVSGYLVMSNVQTVQEMVNLIVAQRAYEMNSKVITTSDSMMDTANNLKR